jgi:PilZ domain
MQTAEAVRISHNSVELAGVNCLTGAADVVTLEFNRRRCRYRVSWIGCDKDGSGGHAGLESLDPITFIFDAETSPELPSPPSETNAVTLMTALPARAKTSEPQSERRLHQRYAWGANAQVRKKGIPVNTPCKVSDISLGGCYVELMMPFPEGTSMELDLFWSNRKISLDARVATSHPAIGMGVSFFGFSEEQYRSVQQLIEELSGKPQPTPAATKSPVAVNPALLTQDLLDWFDLHDLLSREQFEKLVQKQKPKSIPSASPAASTGTY